MSQIPLIGPAYEARSLAINARQMVNFYLESGGQDGRTPLVAIGTPGMRAIDMTAIGATGISDVTRGFHVFQGVLFAVIGAQLWRFNVIGNNIGGTLITLSGGTIGGAQLAFPANMVTFADDGITLAFAVNFFSGNQIWVYDPMTDVCTLNTDAGLPQYIGTMDFMGGYGIIANDDAFGVLPANQAFQVSNVFDMATWTPVSEDAASQGPDGLVRVLASLPTLWLLGRRTCEPWSLLQNLSATTDFPFQVQEGAVLNWGCASAASVAKSDGGFYMLAIDERGAVVVLLVQGYTPQRISTHAIEGHLMDAARAGLTASAYGYCYTQDGHPFYQITIPGPPGFTFVYDQATQLWHERAFYPDPLNPDVKLPHKSTCYVNFAGLHLVGWSDGPGFFELSNTTFTDNGVPQMGVIRGPHQAKDNNRQFFRSLEVYIQPAVGNTLTPEPQLRLRISNDGAANWSAFRSVGMGSAAETKKRCQFRRLGTGRDRVYELSIVDPVKRVVMGADQDAEVGLR